MRFLQLAELFQQQGLAADKLAAMDAELAVIKQQIEQHFNGQVPALTLIRFSSATKALIYGANSIAEHTLQQLNINSAIDSSRSQWGEKEVTIAKLAEISTGLLLYIQPIEDVTVLGSEDWLALPLVNNKRVLAMPPVWSYGGAMSVLYHARGIRDALLNSHL